MGNQDLSPDFDESVVDLRKFLRRTGYSDNVVWITAADVIFESARVIYVKVPIPAQSEAGTRELYRVALEEKRGILLAALCRLNHGTCCYAWVPKSDSDAVEHLMPPGLKLSVPVGGSDRYGECVRSRIR